MNDEELLAEVKRMWEHWAGHLGISPNIWMMFKIDKDISNRLEMRFQTSGYQRVVLAISPDFNQEDPDSWPLSKSVLHEAVHTFHRPLLDAVGLLLWSGAQAGINEAEEGVTDIVTSAIYRMHEQTGCNA